MMCMFPYKDMSKEKELVDSFAHAMYEKMLKRRDRYNEFGWRGVDMSNLLSWLDAEMHELEEEDDPDKKKVEAVDVALIAMFIWDIIERNKAK